MKLPEYRRLTKTDYEDLPEWVDPINRHFELLTTLAHGNATFADNHLAEIRTLEVPHDESFAIELRRLRRNPSGVLVLSTSFFEYYRFTWQMSPTAQRTVDVKILWDTVPSEDPEVTLLFIGG